MRRIFYPSIPRRAVRGRKIVFVAGKVKTYQFVNIFLVVVSYLRWRKHVIKDTRSSFGEAEQDAAENFRNASASLRGQLSVQISVIKVAQDVQGRPERGR